MALLKQCRAYDGIAATMAGMWRKEMRLTSKSVQAFVSTILSFFITPYDFETILVFTNKPADCEDDAVLGELIRCYNGNGSVTIKANVMRQSVVVMATDRNALKLPLRQ